MKKIAIIGSGIAGLSLANLLKDNLKYKFTIYEKESILNLSEGYGIQLSVNSISILNKMGFNKIKDSEKYNPTKIDFYGNNNKKICSSDLSIFNTSDKKYTTLKRSTLIKFLKDELFSDSIKFSKKLSSVEHINKKFKIKFDDNSVDEVDYLFISDGVFSYSKTIIEKKKIEPNYFGAVAIRTLISPDNASFMNFNNISLIMYPKAHIVLYPVNKQQEINVVCIIRKKLGNKESDKQILEKTFLRENEDLKKLFEGKLKSWPIYTSANPINTKYKNIFYIGDAFFSLPPTMAQGASQSIEAAYELFQLLASNTNDIQKIYFKYRKARTIQIKKRSNLNYFAFHISHFSLIFIRNAIMKILVKNKYFIENYLGKVFRK